MWYFHHSNNIFPRESRDNLFRPIIARLSARSIFTSVPALESHWGGIHDSGLGSVQAGGLAASLGQIPRHWWRCSRDSLLLVGTLSFLPCCISPWMLCYQSGYLFIKTVFFVLYYDRCCENGGIEYLLSYYIINGMVMMTRVPEKRR